MTAPFLISDAEADVYVDAEADVYVDAEAEAARR
jgi:hypothetical protein